MAPAPQQLALLQAHFRQVRPIGDREELLNIAAEAGFDRSAAAEAERDVLYDEYETRVGSLVNGTVKSVDARGAVIQLADDVEGYLRASEFSRDRIEDLSQHVKVGEELETMITNVDRKTRSINLSIKAKDQAEQHEAMQKLAADSAGAATGTTNLGALLKAKMNQQG